MKERERKQGKVKIRKNIINIIKKLLISEKNLHKLLKHKNYCA